MGINQSEENKNITNKPSGLIKCDTCEKKKNPDKYSFSKTTCDRCYEASIEEENE